MDKLFQTRALEDMLTKSYEWLIAHVLTITALQQFMLVCFIVVAASVGSKRLIQWINPNTFNQKYQNLAVIGSHIYISGRQIILLVILPIMLWMAVALAEAIDWPSDIMNGAASLITAWAVIRLTSAFIKSEFLSKTLALSIWIIAALHLLGWLAPTVDTLDKAAITVGQVHISLLHVIKGAAVFGLLLWLSGFLSELLERVLSKSKALNPSQKVLFHKLARITLLGLVIIIGLNAIGIDLTALAVFSGALGIGIGFGLQKVFANLVSGFILLMDKSIKPGDVIAIGDTYGWVNRLGARHVSILTRDGKEHLIPNENLIIEQVENWSYSNNKIRIHIPVGISYNSDVPAVRKLLKEVAGSHPRILKSPEPNCLIKGFGDNSVDLEIRAWIEDPVNGVGNVISGVYEAIWEAFKEHNVEIPFPQRDLHIKSMPKNFPQ